MAGKCTCNNCGMEQVLKARMVGIHYNLADLEQPSRLASSRGPGTLEDHCICIHEHRIVVGEEDSVG